MTECTAGVDADRQIVLHRGFVDRPIIAAPEQHLVHREKLHLHEPRVSGSEFDFLRRVMRVLCGHDDAGAQPRIAIQPFGGNPVVHCTAQCLRQVLAVHGLATVQAVDDGGAAVEAVERLALQHCEVGAGLALCGPPVGAAGDRRA